MNARTISKPLAMETHFENALDGTFRPYVAAATNDLMAG
jgi:hypothetical protein